MILLELLSKKASSYSRIVFMLEKLMPANSLVSCSIFLLVFDFLVIGPTCALLWELGRERERERDKERRKKDL